MGAAMIDEHHRSRRGHDRVPRVAKRAPAAERVAVKAQVKYFVVADLLEARAQWPGRQARCDAAIEREAHRFGGEQHDELEANTGEPACDEEQRLRPRLLEQLATEVLDA